MTLHWTSQDTALGLTGPCFRIQWLFVSLNFTHTLRGMSLKSELRSSFDLHQSFKSALGKYQAFYILTVMFIKLAISCGFGKVLYNFARLKSTSIIIFIARTTHPSHFRQLDNCQFNEYSVSLQIVSIDFGIDRHRQDRITSPHRPTFSGNRICDAS